MLNGVMALAPARDFKKDLRLEVRVIVTLRALIYTHILVTCPGSPIWE